MAAPVITATDSGGRKSPAGSFPAPAGERDAAEESSQGASGIPESGMSGLIPPVNGGISTGNRQKVILETERLFLREMDQGDFRDLAEILQDPQVMYAYERDFSDADVQEWLDNQKRRYAEYGFGLWAVIRKADGRMLGQAGLTMQPFRDRRVLEIGYLFKKAYWHQGYAREAASGCKQYAFETLCSREVHSIIRTNNDASMRVAEGIGMTRGETFVKHYYGKDMPHYLYTVSAV